MLLGLPPELLELVLGCLDPASFSMLLLTNKALREEILDNAAVLHAKLKALPGLHQCNVDCQKDPKALYRKFCAQAALSCQNGASELCDAKIWKGDFPTRCSISQIGILKGLHDLWELAAAVDPESAIVHVYSLHDGFPVPKYMVRPDMLWSASHKLEVLLVNLHELDTKRHITVLYAAYARDRLEDDEYHTSGVFISQTRLKLRRSLILATYTLEPSEGVRLKTRRLLSSIPRDYSPVAMCQFKNGSTTILFSTPICCHTAKYSYSLRLYPSTKEKSDYDPACYIITPSRTNSASSKHPSDRFGDTIPLTHMDASEDRTLWLYSGGDRMPMYQVTACSEENCTLELVSKPESINDDTFFGIHRWFPLGTKHKHHCVENEHGEKCCVSSVLQLANLKTKAGGYAPFLVKGSFDSDTCKTLELDRPFPQLEHEIVAILRNVDYDAFVSHGRIMTVSNPPRLVAIATWNKIQLFNINTSAFLEPDQGSLPPRSLKKSSRQSYHFTHYSAEFSEQDDPTYSKNCGQGYYRSYAKLFDRRIVNLWPIDLPECGIVYSMMFTEDDALWAWTDKGLVRLWWGEGRSRLRDCGSLVSTLRDFRGPISSKSHKKQKTESSTSEEDDTEFD